MPVIEILAITALVIITVVVYHRIGNTRHLTAVHELGHALVCKYYGVPVHEVKLNQCGTGGYTTFDFPSDVKQYAVIIAAGYVAEEQARGRLITGALRGRQYGGDANILRDIIGDDREAEANAIMRATEILARDDVIICIQDLTPILIGEGEIFGSRIHYPQ